MIDQMKADILAISAHPDDVEISCAGTIARMTSEGFRVAIVDCSRGELGSRGSIELRAAEAANADKVMGIFKRVNLGLPDGRLMPNPDYILEVAKQIRIFRPKIILFPPAFERHPDHEGVHRILRAAAFHSGLRKIELKDQAGNILEPWRADRLFCFIQAYHHDPDFIIDISPYLEQKIRAVQCYSSQVYVPGEHDDSEPETFISTPQFFESITNRSRYLGSMIGVEHAEGFLSIEPLSFNSLSVFL
jgi:bacillithiol biosynthesis deacetylase BshB1